MGIKCLTASLQIYYTGKYNTHHLSYVIDCHSNHQAPLSLQLSRSRLPFSVVVVPANSQEIYIYNI